MKLRNLFGIGVLGLSLATPAFAAQTQSNWYYLQLWPPTRTSCHYEPPTDSEPWCDDNSNVTPNPSKMFNSLNGCNKALAADKFDNALTPYGGVVHDFGCFELSIPSIS